MLGWVRRCGPRPGGRRWYSAQGPPRSKAGHHLVEVGKFLPKRAAGGYEPGQLFLHKVFAYRGVVLFPWTAKVYDRGTNNSNPGGNNPARELKGGRNATFYQVLMDQRDAPHVRSRSEAVTFLGSRDGPGGTKGSVYVVPGLDIVSHEDVMPFSSSDPRPVQHELFDKFLRLVPGKTSTFVGLDSLKAWKKKNNQVLENSEVHIETTEGVRVTVMPFFLGQRDGGQYWWRYCVRLENLGGSPVRLRERLWRLFSVSGTLETVRGRGVVGSEPLLDRAKPAFQYSSHVSLQAPSGHMWGTFRMEREDGYAFDCRIPPFPLEAGTGK